jgi:DHA2 family multidrug resistance protein
MMRNLGGAVGIALIDTILYGRTAGHADAIRQRLIAGDVTAAQAIGLDRLPPDVSAIGPLIEQAALATSANEAWALLAGVAVLGLLLIPFACVKTDAAKH